MEGHCTIGSLDVIAVNFVRSADAVIARELKRAGRPAPADRGITP
jgi:hypothetical protein